jgi:hypothetical protein
MIISSFSCSGDAPFLAVVTLKGLGLGSFAPRSGTRLERSETILTNQKAIKNTIIKQSGKIRKNQKKIRKEAIRNQKKSDEIRKSDAIRNQKRSFKLDNQMQS